MRRAALVLVVAITALFAGYWSGERASHATRSPSTTSAAHKVVLPTLHESFTLLTCDRATTIGLEGCAEHRILHSDALISRFRRAYFRHLSDGASRRDFVVAEQWWQRYRQASCTSVADAYHGGSFAPVAYGDCLASLNQAHVVDLEQLFASPR